MRPKLLNLQENQTVLGHKFPKWYELMLEFTCCVTDLKRKVYVIILFLTLDDTEKV